MGVLPDYFLHPPPDLPYLDGEIWRIGRLSTPKTKTLVADGATLEAPSKRAPHEGHHNRK